MIVYETLDVLVVKPPNPVYEDIMKHGKCIGYRLTNGLIISKGSWVVGLEHPNWDYAVIIFDTAFYKFLLKPVGQLKLKNDGI